MSAFTERYIEARKLSRTSAASHRKAFQRFQEIVGDRPLSEITKNDVVHFVEALEATRSDKREREPLKSATVKKYLSHINGLFKAQLKKNRVRVNPAEDVGITGRTDPQAPADERKPFTPEQLKKIFNAPIFNGCQSASRLTKPGTTKVRDGRFWYVPVMCFTGARNGEVEALSPFDVVKHHDLWHIDINKANKTKAGARLVPIHSELIKMGFLDWVALRRVEAPDETLFEKRKYGRIWNDRILPAAGVKEDLTCTYSFRHNFEDGLKEVVQDETKQRLMGHTTKAMGGRYGNGTVTRAQARAIEKLDYGELDLTYLHKYDSVEEALAHARL
jgi:integrase